MTNVLLAICGLSAVLLVGGFAIVSWRNRTPAGKLLQTGLRVLDVFVPLPKGKDILLTGDPGSGTVTLANELAWRFHHETAAKHKVVYFLDLRLSDIEERQLEIAESLPMLPRPIACSSVAEIKLLNELEQTPGKSLVVFAATEESSFLTTLRDTVRRVREQPGQRKQITLIALSETANSSGFDAVVTSVRRLAQEGVYPAIDLAASTSTIEYANQSPAQSAHSATSSQAMQVVVQGLYSGAVQDGDWDFNRDEAQRPALQSLCFISQPYFTAEPFTGKKATRVTMREATNGFATITAGTLRHLPASRFLYQNSLPS